jgi:hypothetical protein
MSKNHATQCPHFAEKPAGHHKGVFKNPVTKLPHLLNSRQDITNGLKNFVTNCPNFASGKGGHDVTDHLEEGGRYVTCDKLSNLKLG